MASVEIVPVADAIKATLEEAMPAVKVYKWVPLSVSTPAVVIEFPSVTRTGIEERESQMGTDDWNMSFPVVLHLDLTPKSQETAAEYVETLLKAIDANPSLSGTVLEAKATESEVSYGTDTQKALMFVDITVDVLRLV